MYLSLNAAKSGRHDFEATTGGLKMDANKRFKNYFAGIGTGSFRMLLQVLVGLWLTPFTLRYLDRQEFAVFTLTLEVLNWLTLFDIGITAGLRTQAARFNNHTESDRTNRLASTAFFSQSAIVFLVVGVGTVMAVYYSHFFPIRPELHQEASIVMFLCVVGVAITILTQTFSALLVANQQIHIDNTIGVLLIVIRTVLIVLFLKMGFGLISLALAHLAARTVTAIMAIVRVRRILPELKVRLHFASWQELKRIGSVGIWLSVGGLAGMAIDSISSVVTAKVVSLEALTSLVLTGRLYQLTGSFVWLVSETARPIFGRLLGENELVKSVAMYRQIFSVSTAAASVAALAVWSANACFVPRWVGSVNYAGHWVDLALAVAMVIHLCVLPNRVVLTANLCVRQPCVSRIVEGVFALALSFWLGTSFGLIGVVVGTIIAAAITSIWYLPLLTARMFKQSLLSLLGADAMKILFLVALLLPVAIWARSVAMDVSGFAGAAFGAGVTGTCGAVLLWFVVLRKHIGDQLLESFPFRPFAAVRRS